MNERNVKLNLTFLDNDINTMEDNTDDYSIDLIEHRQKLRHYNQLEVELAKRKFKLDDTDDDDIVQNIKEQMRAIDI